MRILDYIWNETAAFFRNHPRTAVAWVAIWLVVAIWEFWYL